MIEYDYRQKMIENFTSKKLLAFEESIQMISNQQNNCMKDMSSQSELLKNTLKNNLVQVENNLSELDNTIASQEQWYWLQNLEFVGLPKQAGQMLTHTIKKLVGCAKLKIEPKDINFAHRVQTTRRMQGKPLPIIVCFTNRVKMYVFICRKKATLSVHVLRVCRRWRKKVDYIW